MYPDRTPPINATGVYVLRSPFYADPAIDYRCEAIRGFEALEEDQINPYDEFYLPHGIDTSQYTQDKNAGINIITLMTAQGLVIQVPSSYIISFPTSLDAAYSRVVISVSVGALPDSYNLSFLTSEFQQMAENAIGNDVSVKVHKLPWNGFITLEESKSVEAARLISSIERANSYGSKINSDNNLNIANNKIGALESIVKTLA